MGCMYICIHTYIHTDMYTHVYIYTCTDIETQRQRERESEREKERERYIKGERERERARARARELGAVLRKAGCSFHARHQQPTPSLLFQSSTSIKGSIIKAYIKSCFGVVGGRFP